MKLKLSDLTVKEKQYIIETYNTSRYLGSSRYYRLLYTQKWFIKENPIYKDRRTSIYLLIDELTQVLKGGDLG